MALESISKLQQLKRKQAQLNARIQAMEAREKTLYRKHELRRKILLGSYYLSKAREENALEALKTLMDAYLTRSYDKALFDVPEEKETTEGL